jgi:hypothetical protein
MIRIGPASAGPFALFASGCLWQPVRQDRQKKCVGMRHFLLKAHFQHNLLEFPMATLFLLLRKIEIP